MLDVPLGFRGKQQVVFGRLGLNPCYVGCASRLFYFYLLIIASTVLILVMLDVPLG